MRSASCCCEPSAQTALRGSNKPWHERCLHAVHVACNPTTSIYATRAVMRSPAADESAGRGVSRGDSAPALQARLDAAFPEFGFRPDALGSDERGNDSPHLGRARRTRRRAWPSAARHPDPRRRRDPVDRVPQRWPAPARGEAFVATVKELAARAGVDTAPIQRAQPRDRRTDLLHDFFTPCRMELQGKAGLKRATIYSGEARRSPRPLRSWRRPASGRYEAPARDGRLHGARNQPLGRTRRRPLARSRLRYCQATSAPTSARSGRAIHDADTAPKFLYLRGAGRSGLPPYGLSDVLKLPPTERRELVLVEGLLDVHHLRAHGLANIAAVGAARRSPRASPASRSTASRRSPWPSTTTSPAATAWSAPSSGSPRRRRAQRRVVDPERLGTAKDPDAYVRERGIDAFRSSPRRGGVRDNLRALDHARRVTPDSDRHERRAALAQAGEWLGTLPARLALEQEDAILAVSERCGYAPEAVDRAFRARFSGFAPNLSPGTCRSVRNRTRSRRRPVNDQDILTSGASWRMATRPARASREARARILHAAVAVGQRDRTIIDNFDAWKLSTASRLTSAFRDDLIDWIEGSDVEQTP